MVTDPIADMLTRIKNAYLAHHQVVEMPHSKMKEEIAKILLKENYLKKLMVEPVKPRTRKKAKTDIKKIVCKLLYKKGKPALNDLKRISTPGRRIYERWGKIPWAMNGYGITIVSTSKGVMTDKEARKKKLGGEIICQVW